MSNHNFLSSKIIAGDGVIKEHHHKGLIVLVVCIAIAILVIAYYAVLSSTNVDYPLQVEKTPAQLEMLARENISASINIAEASREPISENEAQANREKILKMMQ